MDIVVEGGDDLHRLAKRLRKAGEKDLIKGLQKAIKSEVKPIVEAQRREVRALPAKGARHTGLRSRTAGAVRIQVKTTGGSAGVRIRVAKTARLGLLPQYMNRGHWRKPVFGNRKVWRDQQMPPGWFDRPAEKGAPHVRKQVVAAMEDVAEQIAHGGTA